jgi:hypothetical protein
LHGNAIISFHNLKTTARFNGEPIRRQETHVFEPFTELLLEKVGVFFEQNQDERMKPRRRILIRLHDLCKPVIRKTWAVQTSIVIMNPINASFTRRYPSGSVSVLKALSKARQSLPNRESQSSSSSCSERKLPVVLRTWVSTIKNPATSWMREVSALKGIGIGRIRSD